MTEPTGSGLPGLDAASISLSKPSSALTAPRIIAALGLVAALGFTVAFFADWVKLEAAWPAFRAQPLLLVGLAAAYTAAFGLRAVAWRTLMVHPGDNDASGAAAVEALLFYISIQPDVAKASAAVDEAVVAYFESAPGDPTAAQLDAALATLNGTASALFLTPDDLVTSFQ